MGLCRLHSISRQLIELSRDVSVRLVSAVVMSRLDYCNAVLAGLPAATRTQSQRVLNAAARLALDLKPRDRATSASCTGYPFHNRSTTSCVHIHRSVTQQTTWYICDLLTTVANTLNAARLQQRQPLSVCTDRAAIWRPCCSPCVQSVTDRTETHAVVNNNIQASFQDIILFTSAYTSHWLLYGIRHRVYCKRRSVNVTVTKNPHKLNKTICTEISSPIIL